MAQSKAFTDASHALNDLSRALALLEAENAKLRTFIDGLMFCHASSAYDDCIGCPLLDQSTHNYRCTKTECMRELGIEGADA